MRNFILLGMLTAVFYSCTSNHSDKHSIRYHDDGRAKAVVTLTPVYDPQNIRLPWSLASDLSEIIEGKLSKRSNVFLATKINKVEDDTTLDGVAISNPLPLDENKTLSIHPENLKVKYPKSEFVVFLELAGHNIHPKQETDSILDKLTPSYVLDMSMRVRIYDLRHENPILVLQELVQQSHMLPKQFAKLDYAGAVWGKKTYSISPMGFAHAQFAKDVSGRIEQYLILAKTK